MNTQIGKSIQIKGTVTAEEPVTIAGRVQGSIAMAGHTLTVAADGHIDVEAVADTIVLDGTAVGKLNATTRMLIHQGATVTADLSAPTLAITEGATIHGRIETGARKGAA